MESFFVYKGEEGRRTGGINFMTFPLDPPLFTTQEPKHNYKLIPIRKHPGCQVCIRLKYAKF